MPGALGDNPGRTLRLLGGFEVQIDDEPRSLTMGAQRIVALLGTYDTPLPRRFVAFTLWLDKDESRALANLRSMLWRLGDELTGVVEADAFQIRLSGDMTVDFLQARREALEVLDGKAVGVTHTYLSDLLPGWYEEWVVVERERLRLLHLHALERQGEQCLERGDFGESVNCAIAAVTIDPLRESAHRMMIQAMMSEGNIADAVRVYDAYRARMMDVLGMEPSKQISEMIWSDERVAL